MSLILRFGLARLVRAIFCFSFLDFILGLRLNQQQALAAGLPELLIKVSLYNSFSIVDVLGTRDGAQELGSLSLFASAESERELHVLYGVLDIAAKYRPQTSENSLFHTLFG